MIVKSGEKISVMHDFYDLYEKPVQPCASGQAQEGGGGAKYYEIMRAS